MRLSKSPAEINSLQRAIDISELALAETDAKVKAGMTERQTLNLLKSRMLAGEAEGFSFEPIVLIGGNAANPHGSPGDIALKPGDALLIDYGASVDGYNADISRTFFCDHVSDDHAAIYNTVLAASPYGALIVHMTGHGLGLDVHEAPQIMKGNHASLIPGTVFTIEPGLYRLGDIGVRIEDDVVTDATGARSLTSFPRELTILGAK